MSEKNIIDIWKNANHKKLNENNLDENHLKNYIKRKVKKHGSSPLGLIFSYMAVQLGAIVFGSLNLIVYKTNPVLISVNLVIIFLMILFFSYGIRLFKKYKEQNKNDEDTISLIKRKLEFNTQSMEKWFIICGLTLMAFTFTFIINMEPEDGFYKINKPHIFAGFQIISFLFIYFISKFSVRFSNKQLDLYLMSLEQKMLDSDVKIRDQKRKQVIIAVIFALVGLALLGLFIYRSGNS